MQTLNVIVREIEFCFTRKKTKTINDINLQDD